MSTNASPCIEVGHAVSCAEDAGTAGASVARQAVGEGLGEDLSVVLVFSSARYHLDGLLAGIRSVVGDVPILGGTTSGEIRGGMHHGSVVAVALASPYLRVSAAVGHNVSRDWRKAVDEALACPSLAPHFGQEGKAHRDTLRRQGTSVFALVLSPGETAQAESSGYEIFEELRARSGGQIPICGGGVSDDGAGKANFVFADGCSHGDSLLVAVFETQLTFGFGVCHSYTPELPRRTATRTRGHEVLEIDGRPADAVFAEMLGTSVDELRGKDLCSFSPMAVDMVTPDAGYTITLPRCLTESHGVRLAQSVEEGSSISVMRVNSNNVARSGGQAVLRALASGRVAKPAVVLAFADAARERMLGEQMVEDIAGLSRWTEGVPTVGILTSGEAGVCDDGVNRFGNGLVSTLVLGEELTPAAELWQENRQLLAEQTEAVRALEESEERFRLLLKNSSDGIVICERLPPDYRRSNTLFMNDRFVEMSGFTREELLAFEDWGKLSVRHKTFPDGVKVEQAFGQDEAMRGLSSWQRPDGKPNFREWTAVPLRIRGKLYSIGINRDVTERMQEEQRRETMVADLRIALNVADNLLACPDVDSLCRKAVEMVRTELGLERCSIFLLQDDEMRGTYGTDTQGGTICEHDVRIRVDVAAWLAHHAQEGSEGPRWKVLDQGEHVQWDGKTRRVIGAGWTVSTLIWPESAGCPVGVMYNDAAITHGPLDSMKQEVVAVFCSTLGSIIARKQRDEQIRLQATLLDQIQDLVTATDMEGRITFVNQANCALFGKRAEDVVGTQVEAYGKDAGSGATQEEIIAKTRAEGHWRGRVVDVDAAGNDIVLDCRTQVVRDGAGDPVGLIGVSTDITERDGQERMTAALLRLLDYAGNHTVRELLQTFLDEVEELTTSEVGFLHFIEPDQETVTLQMWSTNTLATMCKAEGEPRHYSIHQAGVWGDCVRERRPVIHNDYAGLTQERGLPEGHVPVVRELVVPVLRAGKVVAVLGVGNKKTDYHDTDARTVTQLADLAWETIIRRQAEEALAEREQFMRRIFDLSLNGLSIHDLTSHKHVFINRRYTELTGHTLEDLNAMSPDGAGRALYHPDDLPRLSKHAAQVCELAEDAPARPIEFRMHRGDGEWIWCLSWDVPFERDRDGNVCKILSTFIDITDRKKAEEERARLTLAIEQAGEAVVITDDQGTIEYVNPAFERSTGYTREEAIGQNPSILKSGEQDDVFYQELWETLRAGDTWTGRFANKRKDGTLYTEDAVISPVRDGAGRTINYVAVKRDVTRELEREDQLRQRQKMEAVGRLAGGVAHDFNNLLMGIMNYVELCRDEVGPDHPIRGWLDEVSRDAKRSAEIVRQLLGFARKQNIVPRELDLNGAVSGMVNMLQRLIRENIHFFWTPAPEPCMVRVDPGQIDQILANLVVNARDAIEGTGSIAVETANVTLHDADCSENAAVSPGAYVMLAVTDDGGGMAPGTLEHIFEPFFTTKPTGEGIGLGLATVYGIVEQNGGFARARSELGEGSTIEVYLPRLGSVDSLPDEVVPETQHRLDGDEVLLLVEDERSIRVTLQYSLEHLGYTVLVADSSQAAFELVAGHAGDIDLLITDVVLPDLSGPELAKRLKVQYPGLTCLYMSGYAPDAVVDHGLLDPGAPFLQKPVPIDTLVGKARELLDGRGI